MLDAVARRLRVEVTGAERLPPGRGLIVANHAFGFWDLALALARIRALTGREVWSLGEHLWWQIPIVRRIAREAGIVDGTPENADALLREDKLVLVLPGGLREALKPRELRYRLLWGRRYGFVRAAMRNDAPIIPLACIGGDDLFDIVGDAYARGRRWHLGIPLPRPAHLLPILHPTQLRFMVGEPIPVTHRGSESDARAVRSLRREVEGAIHEMLEDELSRRAGFPVTTPPHPPANTAPEPIT
ncbi:MAG: acyltransferase family protein [Labilithrix sp.]|nr:acyltransferase family protein [Labilithrix sp.]MCW5812584.1 acyltransferase family protein [Labilithrix sp.]